MELFYRKFGAGHPLIILHGLYGSSTNWITVGKVFAKQFEVFLPDLRNHGNSPFSSEHSYDLMKDDLDSFMRSQNIEKAIIIGHSMGGKTAMFFAAAFPEKVRALVVVDISPRSYKSLNESDHQYVDHKNIIDSLLSLNLSILKSREDADRFLLNNIQSSRVRQFLLKNLHRNHDGSFSWKLNVHAIHDNLHQIMEGLDEHKYDYANGIAGFPVLFIRGEKSNYIENIDIPVIKKIFPMAEIVTVPGAGHWLHAEQPELFIKTVSYFLSGK